MAEDEVQDAGEERKAFLEDRKTVLGATDTPKILGLAKYGTALTVYDDKRSETPDRKMSLPAWLGLKMQRTVGELYTAATGVQLRADNKFHKSKAYPFIGCHLDFRAWGRPKLLVECKTRAYMKGWGDDGSEQIPADVWAQVQHEMLVTGADEAHVAVLFGHHTFRVYRIPRNAGFLEKLIPRLERFWHENVLAGLPPEPTGHALDSERVKQANAEHDDTLKAATAEQEAIIRQLQMARQNLLAVVTRHDEIENRIKTIIGDALGIQFSFGTIIWRRTKDGETIDWQQIALTYANIIEQLLEDANPEGDELVQRFARAQSVYETAVGLFTSPKPGHRRFVVTFNEEPLEGARLA